MYEVIIQNGNLRQTIHEANVLFTKNKLASCKIVDARNAISSCDFTIYPNNEGYESLNVYTTKVSIFNTKKQRYDFVGRIIQITPCMDSDGSVYKTVVCESRLGYLCDTIQPYADTRQYEGDENRNGLQEFIDVLLNNHNTQVDADHRIYRGNVSVITHESSEGVYKGLNYETTWECLTSKLLDVFGGEIQLRETNGILYLDYAEELGSTRSTTIELGKNMESVQRSIDCTSIITRLIPLGAKLTEQIVGEDGNVTEKETENRLTIESVNNGVLYIESEEAVGLYGYIYRTVIFDDVTDPNNLKIKGTSFLAENNTLMESNTIASLDLSLLGIDIDDFRVYDKYPCRNELVGLYATLEIIKKTTDVIEPHSSTFEMGSSTVSMAGSILDITSAVEDIPGEIKTAIETAIDNNNDTVYTIINKTVETSLQQSEESIVAKVSEQTISKSDYETFTQTVRNILQIDADGTTMLFQTINEAIQEVGSTAESHYSEILKYIRFEDGNIILGEKSNPLTLKIENDRIAFYQNGVVVAYFTDNKLYVTHGEFTETLMVGKFQAAPRANGNVSWKVVI